MTLHLSAAQLNFAVLLEEWKLLIQVQQVGDHQSLSYCLDLLI